MIQATITGRLAADPEEKTPREGVKLIEFRVASTHRDRVGATWVRVTVWREKLGRFVMDKARKGARVCVSGAMELQVWGSESDHFALQLDCDHVELYDWPDEQAPCKPKPKPAPKKTARGSEPPIAESNYSGDLPF